MLGHGNYFIFAYARAFRRRSSYPLGREKDFDIVDVMTNAGVPLVEWSWWLYVIVSIQRNSLLGQTRAGSIRFVAVGGQSDFVDVGLTRLQRLFVGDKVRLELALSTRPMVPANGMRHVQSSERLRIFICSAN